MQINQEEQMESERDHATQGYTKKKASKALAAKTCGGCSGRRNSQPHRRVHSRDPQGPRAYTKPPTWESTLEEPDLLVGSRGTD